MQLTSGSVSWHRRVKAPKILGTLRKRHHQQVRKDRRLRLCSRRRMSAARLKVTRLKNTSSTTRTASTISTPTCPSSGCHSHQVGNRERFTTEHGHCKQSGTNKVLMQKNKTSLLLFKLVMCTFLTGTQYYIKALCDVFVLS